MAIENLTDLKARTETNDTLDQAYFHNMLESVLQGNRKATIPDAHTELHTDTDHDVQVSAGSAWAANDDYLLKWGSAQVKQIDASWASGTNAGGLSSSLSLAADTWYHLFVFEIGGTIEFGWDTSITAANLIADHSAGAYRRIASHQTDASSNLLAYKQKGQEFSTSLNLVLDTTSTATSLSDLTLDIPHSELLAKVSVGGTNSNSNDIGIAVYRKGLSGGHVDARTRDGHYDADIGFIQPDSSKVVQYITSASSGWSTNCQIGTVGWFDFFTV